MSSFATEWAGEFTVVAVFLVGRFGCDVVFDTFLAERVKTVQTLRVLVSLEADLADEEFVVYFLGQPSARRSGHAEIVMRLVMRRNAVVNQTRSGSIVCKRNPVAGDRRFNSRRILQHNYVVVVV